MKQDEQKPRLVTKNDSVGEIRIGLQARRID